MKRKMVLLFATAIIAAVALATAGITLALTTDETPSSGSITTASLELSAKAQNLHVYSATAADGNESPDTEIFYDSEDESTRKAYKYVESVNTGDSLGVIKFKNHSGGASISDKAVTVTGFLPGDKITFDIAVTADSTVSYFYRTELGVETALEKDVDLFKSLEFTASNGIGVKNGIGLRKTESENGGDAAAYSVLTDYTLAEKVAGNITDVETVNVTVSFPMTEKKGQGGTVSFRYTVSAVQDDSESPIVAEYTFGGETVKFDSLSEAVESAAENGVDTVRVVGSTKLEEGAVNLAVSDYVKIVGVKDEAGNLPILRGARIKISDGSAAVFENIRFTGDGYIDVSDAGALTLRNCIVSTVPVSKNFDGVTNEFLPESAFVVSGSSLTPVRLVLEDNEFIQSGSAAVYLGSRIVDGTLIKNNTFGSSEKVYSGTVVTFGGAEESEVGKRTTRADISQNTVFGCAAFDFGSRKNGRYDVYSSHNSVIADKFACGIGDVAFIDGGSTLGGEALALSGIDAKDMLFAGVGVEMRGEKIAAGNFALSDAYSCDAFFFDYIGVTLDRNLVFVAYGGQNYVMSSADGDHCIVEEI